MRHQTEFSPLISFLTVNYNQPVVTLDLVRSLQHLTYKNWELVVVDNGGETNNLAVELKPFKGVKYLRSEENLGFAGGNNLGLPLCDGEFIFFINNDTEVKPGLIEPLLYVMKNDPELGMLCPKIKFFHQPELIQYAGFTEMNRITIRNRGIGWMEHDKGQYDDTYKTAFGHGAAMIVPKKVIDEVGPMYDDYFLYYEEYDWAQRIKDAGYRIVYCGKSIVLHKESVSTGQNSPLKTYYLTRNRLLFARRNYKWHQCVLTWLYFSFIALPKNILQHLVSGKKDLAGAFLRGYFWNFAHK